MPTILRPKKKYRKRENSTELYRRRREVYNTKAWKRLRETKLSQQPLCEVCLEKGITTPATEVHHVTSFAGFADRDARMAYAFDFNNLQSICKKCHAEEHNLHR